MLEADLPAITASAEAAAKACVEENVALVAAGDFGVVGKAVGRVREVMRFQ